MPSKCTLPRADLVLGGGELRRALEVARARALRREGRLELPDLAPERRDLRVCPS